MNPQLHIDLARKYAFAYLNAYCNSLSRDDLHALTDAHTFLKDHHKITFFLKLSAISDDIKTKQLFAVCDKFALPDSIKKLITLLLNHKRASLLPLVFAYIVQLYKECVGIEHFTIMSSHELDEAQQKHFEQFLAQQTGRDNIYTYKKDNRLIAGIRLQSGTLLWEHSIAKQLRHMELLLVA